MLGLMKYNYHATWSSVRVALILCLSLIFVVVTLQAALVFSLAVSLVCMMFSFCIFGTSDHVDSATLWASFEFLLPVEKKKIVLAKYVSFLIFLLIGVCTGFIILLLQYILRPDLPLSTLFLDMLLGVGVGLGFGATLLVETSASKSGENQGVYGLLFLLAPLFLLILVGFGVAKWHQVSLVQLFLDKSIYRIALYIFVPASVLLWLVSYPISVKLYKTKEF